MIPITLYGTPICRRYQRMREMVINASQRLGVPIELQEIGDTESLSQIDPLSLPRLYISDRLVASQNPPRVQEVELALGESLTNQ
ncbi:MAG: hypothetical protein ABI621_12370 [Chloroflexota bacterium]